RRTQHIKSRPHFFFVRRRSGQVMRKPLPQLCREQKTSVRRHLLNPQLCVLRPDRRIKTRVDLNRVKKLCQVFHFVKSLGLPLRIHVPLPVCVGPPCWPRPHDWSTAHANCFTASFVRFRHRGGKKYKVPTANRRKRPR